MPVELSELILNGLLFVKSFACSKTFKMNTKYQVLGEIGSWLLAAIFIFTTVKIVALLFF